LAPEEVDRILEEHAEESQSSRSEEFDEELERELLELERMLEEEEKQKSVKK